MTRQPPKTHGLGMLAKEFALLHGLTRTTVTRHLTQGYCSWPRRDVSGRMAAHPLYKTWHQIQHRCHNPNASDYAYYGGRGIHVCAEWRGNFWAFTEYMGPRPDGGTIDRIDVDGNYEPGNVKWATRKEQAQNRRIPSTNKSGVMGLSYEAYSDTWVIDTTIAGTHYRYRRKHRTDAEALLNHLNTGHSYAQKTA